MVSEGTAGDRGREEEEACTHVGLELGDDLHAERVDAAVVLQRLQHILRPHHLGRRPHPLPPVPPPESPAPAASPAGTPNRASASRDRGALAGDPGGSRRRRGARVCFDFSSLSVDSKRRRKETRGEKNTR